MPSPFTKVAAYIWRLFETDGVPSSGMHLPKKEEIILWGTEMETLLSEAPARVGIQYKFSEETNTEENPGSGYLRFNLASPAPEGVTEIAISDLDVFGLDFSGLIAAQDDSTNIAWRSTMIIREQGGEFAASFRIRGANIDEAGWTRLQVEWVSGSGSFTNNANLGVLLFPSGNEGGTKIAVPIFDPAAPVGGEVMWAAPMPTPTTFLAGLTESFGTCSTVPTANAVFSIRKAAAGVDPAAAVEFATATYLAGTRAAVFAAAVDTDFNGGDVLVIVAPDPKDATLTRPSFTLVGHLSS